MKMGKKVLVWILMAALLLAGCGSAAPVEETETETAEDMAAEASSPSVEEILASRRFWTGILIDDYR